MFPPLHCSYLLAQVVPGIVPKSLVVPLVNTGNSRVEVPAQVFALCFTHYARAVLDNFQLVA